MSQLRTTSDGSVRTIYFVTPRILDELGIRGIGEELLAILERSEERNILLDFRAVQFMSSSALGILIRFSKRCKDFKARLMLCNISPEIFQVFKITSLDKILEIHKDHEEAVAAFAK